MGMMDPKKNDPLDRLSDKYPDGTPFFLENVRWVNARSKEYGDGEMVVLRVRGNDNELGVWGAYLLTQAKSVEPSDLNAWYKIERKRVEGFGKGDNLVKAFVPAEAPAPATTAAAA